jgi:predicted CxxxxCH...CXXCH cytochrome family protein
MRTGRRAGALAGIMTILIISAWALRPGSVLADHGGGASCYECHDLTGTNVQAGTHLLARSAMAELRSHGWVQGMRPGCTFCHRSVNNVYVPDVLSSFAGATPPGSSRHPVSRNFATGVVDNTPYLSSDNISFAGHLDCKDCHDITLTSYPNHDNGWLNSTYTGGGSAQKNKATNPFGLRLVSAPKAYDTLCRNCHTSAAGFLSFTGKSGAGASKLVLSAHDNGADNTVNSIRDLDNTQLRTQVEYSTGRQCSICHDAHESQNLHMFSDGHERKWDNTSEVAINELTDCTTVCHYRGDSLGVYDVRGHGKASNWNGVALSRNCTACHDASKPHLPSSTDYSTKYRFPTLDNSWIVLSVFNKAVKSVCAQCHGAYPVHNTARGGVGCIDCHDQHAKSSDNNVMMIRSTNRVAGSIIGVSGVGAAIASEPVLFRKSEKYPTGIPAGTYPNDNTFHYYSNISYQGDASAGFCDQRACHGNRLTSPALTPLSTLMSGGQHTGDDQGAQSDCESCHHHGDTGGSFRAVSSCTSCHGQPPPPSDNSSGYPYNEGVTPHVTHASATTYKVNCRVCHNRYTKDPDHDSKPTKTYQSVFFDNGYKRGVPLSWDNLYDNSTRTCSNIYCHSDGRGNAPNVAPVWVAGSPPGTQVTLNCAGCHNSDGVSLAPAMSSGAHTKHLNDGYACSSCHVSTVSDDNQVLNPSTGYTYHVDNTRTVTIKSTYDNDATPGNNWSAVDNSCTGITCHGGNKVGWYSDIGLVNCQNCHAGTGDLDDFGTGGLPATMSNNGRTARIDNAEWTTRGHGRTAGTYAVTLHPMANFAGTGQCAYCHNPAVGHDNAANPFRLANNNVYGNGWNDVCMVCHRKTPAPGGYDPDGGGSIPSRNSTVVGTRVDNNHFGAKHTTTYNGGKFCYDCHEPHGDNNIFMIGSRVTRATDNVFGIPLRSSIDDNTNRPAVAFADNTTGANYADNTTRLGICQVCHTTGVVNHWTGSAPWSDGHNASVKCTSCHTHDAAFKGAGGNNIEQFFDKPVRAFSVSNYDDMSRHPIRTDNVLFDAAQVDCYGCHNVTGSTYRQNECLKCHWENRPSNGTPTHPNNIFEWATPGTPATQLAVFPWGTVDNNNTLCLQCHGVGGSSASLGNPAQTPTNIFAATAGETVWTSGSGHGQGTLKLAKDNLAGPPAYYCAECHKSSAIRTSGQTRDVLDPGVHASINRKLVRNDNTSDREYPHPNDNTYATIDQRSGKMDGFCSTKCHRVAGGATKDDNVVDHTWNLIGGQTRSGSLTHPTNFLVTTGTYYQQATLLPYSDWLDNATAPMPAAGNAVCVTCHNPHGGGNIRDSGGAAVTPIGMKNMLRLSPADNVSTLCKQCHR